MKKAILLTVFSVFLLASKSEAQGFGFVTSFGVTQQWDVPYEVYYSIDNYYLGYNWVHAQRAYNNQGRLFFDVTLQRGEVFVRVSLDRYGRIFNRAISYSYPLNNHVCNSFCGFHSNFYVNNRNVCSGHNHYGHNHVNYRPVVIYQQPKGHAYGYHKQNKGSKKNYGYHEEVYRPVNRRSGAAIASNREKSRLDLDKGRNGGHGYGSGNDQQGGQGRGYGRGDDKGNNGNNGNKGNNGNAYGRGKDTGKGSGLGRGRGDGSSYSQDDRSSRGKNKTTTSRPAYRSRVD